MIEDWQNRPLNAVYPILYIDTIHYSVRDNGVIRKLAAYVILGINTEGKKEVLSINIGDNESAKYWLSVLNKLKNRGVKDILIICADGHDITSAGKNLQFSAECINQGLYPHYYLILYSHIFCLSIIILYYCF